MRKLLRRTGVVLAALVVVLACALGVSPYLRRWAWLGFPDVYDHDKLPARIVTHGSRSFQLPTATEGDWVSPLALSYGGRSLRDEAALAEFVAGHGTTALIVLKDGRLLDERYFNGFRRDSLFKSFSVTKSVLSALLGIAIADGFDRQPGRSRHEVRAGDGRPRLRPSTLRHCLDGTAGIEYTRGGLPWSGQPRMYYTTDVRRYVSTAVLRGEPGRSFTPEDLSPIVLGWVLERALAHHASARTLSAYLAERLWQPLGYGRWLGARYHGAPNVIWVNGGDRIADRLRGRVRALARGLREGDGGAHLITYHPCGWRSRAQYFHDDDWLDFNMIQTWTEWSKIHPAVALRLAALAEQAGGAGRGRLRERPRVPTGADHAVRRAAASVVGVHGGRLSHLRPGPDVAHGSRAGTRRSTRPARTVAL